MVAYYVLIVEPKTRSHQTCIGIEMNEQKAVTLVMFDEKDSMQKHQLKELIVDMSHKDPRARIDMNEVFSRINREYI